MVDSVMDEDAAMRQELKEIALWLQSYAARRGIPRARFCRENPGLGSDRTFRDFCQGKMGEYNLVPQLAAYRAVKASCEELAAESADEMIFDDLSSVVSLRKAFATVAQSVGLNRVVVVQGESGVGKSTAARLLSQRYGAGRVITIEASDVWGDRPATLLGEILRAMGRTELPPSRADRLSDVRQALTVARRCLIIDEAHHLGPHCLNTIKTLVNSTPGEFILVAIPSLWGKLQGRAYQEARQLTTNRLSERIKLELNEADVARYFCKHCESVPLNKMRLIARSVVPLARQNGNMAFVRDVVREVGTREFTAESVIAAATSVAARR